MKKAYILPILTVIFLLGWFSNSLYAQGFSITDQIPFGNASEVDSPGDWVKESQISVFDDRVVIEINDPYWSGYEDTNSMDPVLDYGANGIEIIPESSEDLEVGDIIVYEPDWTDGLIVHRIVEKNIDEDGVYFVLQGDNNSTKDPGRVRFEQVKFVLVGVIY